jgi:sulfur-carrier protein
VARLILLGPAREAAGRSRDEVEGPTVGDVLESACARYGEAFAAVLATSRVWVNGDAAEPAQRVGAADEVAVVPPAAGG